MKEKNKDYFDIQKINRINILELVVLFYCLVFFKNYIPVEMFRVINYSINTKVINNYIIYKNIEENVDLELKSLNNADKNTLLNNYKSFDFKDYEVDGNSFILSSFFNKFERISKVEIIESYIKDMLFLIVYYIYSKSRKRSNYRSSRYNKLCIN